MSERDPQDFTPEELLEQAKAYWRQNDAYQAVKILRKLVKERPSWATPNYWLAKIYKQRREWKPCLHYSQRAVECDPKELECWEWMGLAAAALGRWPMARKAWMKLGFPYSLQEGIAEPQLGGIVVCLNEKTRPEIVWANRMDPARARLESVPQPSSGFHHQDILLIERAENMHHILGTHKIPVFRVIERLKDSRIPTFSVELHTQENSEVQLLAHLCHQQRLGFDNWSMANRQMSIRQNEQINYYKMESEPSGSTTLIGLAARKKITIHKVLQEWKSLTNKSVGLLRRH